MSDAIAILLLLFSSPLSSNVRSDKQDIYLKLIYFPSYKGQYAYAQFDNDQQKFLQFIIPNQTENLVGNKRRYISGKTCKRDHPDHFRYKFEF